MLQYYFCFNFLILFSLDAVKIAKIKNILEKVAIKNKEYIYVCVCVFILFEVFVIHVHILKK